MSLAGLDSNNHDDIQLAKGQFQKISVSDWEDYAQFVEQTNMISDSDKYFLQTMHKKVSFGNVVSKDQIFKALHLVEKIDTIRDKQEKTALMERELAISAFTTPVRNITFRLAWHDRGLGWAYLQLPRR